MLLGGVSERAAVDTIASHIKVPKSRALRKQLLRALLRRRPTQTAAWSS